ncbi:MAG: Rrf2 family transcriptional regulator [Nitrospirae bacterium]|nr:Rrf2 family transcriptional regulator [Nitrospirota bacterium]
MHLTHYTDYSLRVLIYLGVSASRPATIREIARAYAISRNHLMKVVHRLGRLGYVETTRGRGGGLRLARDPGSVNLAEVVRRTEESWKLVECFDVAENGCRITPACELKRALGEALQAFYAALGRHTLADVLSRRTELGTLLLADERRKSGRQARPKPKEAS